MVDETEFAISLGVARQVCSIDRRGNRAACRAPDLPREMIPEEVILYRWRRKKTTPGVVFKGTRLPPGTWRAVLACYMKKGGVEGITSSAIRAAIDRLDMEEIDPTLRYPNIDALRVMVTHLEKRRALEPILLRHLLGVDPGAPGIPDLFSYSLAPDGTVASARFVEVKRPVERVSKAQVDELRFLRSLGLRAGLVRLMVPQGSRRPGRNRSPRAVDR